MKHFRSARTVALVALIALPITSATAASAKDGNADKSDDKSEKSNERDNNRFPARIELPTGFRPEGITAGRGTSLYVGSLANGAIWKGDARTGTGAVLTPGQAGMVSVGLDFEKRNNRLWVAGGGTAEVRAVDADSGAILRRYAISQPGFLNDVAVTREAVYITNSNQPLVVVIPTARNGELPAADAPRTIALSGDWVQQPGFNANGIVASDGFLIIVQSGTGFLFRVDPVSGIATRINLGGYLVTNGDGLELDDDELYVMRNRNNIVAKIKLSDDLLSGQLEAQITDPGLDVATTTALQAGRLWAVNARFGIANPGAASFAVIQLDPND